MIHYDTKGNLYKRFIRVPVWLAKTTVFVIWLNVVNLVISKTQSNLSGLVICCSTSFLTAFFLGIAYQIIKMTLMRERIRRWAGKKFSSWEELHQWIFDTPSDELDRLAGLPDDSWLPAITTKDN